MYTDGSLSAYSAAARSWATGNTLGDGHPRSRLINALSPCSEQTGASPAIIENGRNDVEAEDLVRTES